MSGYFDILKNWKQLKTELRNKFLMLNLLKIRSFVEVW